MNRRAIFLIAFAFLLIGQLPLAPLHAEQSEKLWRIGFLSLTKADSFHHAFFDGMRALGYRQGVGFIVESRFAAGDESRLPALAAELARLPVDLIVARGTQATSAAKHATRTIPIVMTGTSDPVGTGLVTSLSRPGGNITGLSILAPDLAEKRLELLRRVVPRASVVGVLWNPTNAGNINEWEQTRRAAKSMKMTLVSREVRQPRDIEAAFERNGPAPLDAVLTLTDALLTSGRGEIVRRTNSNRLPAIFHVRDFVEYGGMMSYGPDLHESFRRAAYYVDRILKGTKPAQLPVEQPIKFELAVNLRTAKQVNVMVPGDVLASADRIIR
ncbi:MAG TPA: ABC transporter substrate-binding protein [Candidatus Binatia bacterium]|jgi:putative ABC transport system substrate-binding protein